ncbi:MAG: O-antigen ligase family protein, partial [Acidobacteria bacterium]|nr:O-antigen ligase family protein [Acidobacteriota bacterium]
MAPTQERIYQAAVWSMLVSAASIVVSIAVSQIFLGLALIALIASDAPLRFPPLEAPLAAFLGWTVVSLLASGHPAAGLPQIRKFLVFTVLLVVFSTLRETRHARWLAGAWSLAAAASALRSLVQFVRKLEAARAGGEDFYQFYVGERITGFLSHWMTFSEVGMLVLLVLLSYLFFAPGISRRTRILGCLAGAFLASSLLVSFTRSIWLSTAAACGYLVWHWRKKLLLAAPLLAALAFVAGPEALHRRIESIFHTRSDSSVEARQIMWQTGWRMIQARPLFGVGPQRVGPEFRRFLPAGVGELPPAFYEHLHNLYIHYAAERGIPAVLALLWLLGRILRDHLRAIGAAP